MTRRPRTRTGVRGRAGRVRPHAQLDPDETLRYRPRRMPGVPRTAPALAIALVLVLAPSAALLASGAARAGATIEGRAPVVTPPPAPPLDDAYLRTLSGPVLPPDPPASVVWLEVDPSMPRPPARAARAEVAQHGFQFRPGLLVVPVGAVVSFPNQDDAYHSIFSYSETKRFDLGRYLRDEAPPTVAFDRPGLVRLYCEIHEHMRGVVLVVDSPWFTITGPDGRYRLDGLPAGRHVVKAWIDPARTLAREITLVDGETLRVDFDEAGP